MKAFHVRVNALMWPGKQAPLKRWLNFLRCGVEFLNQNKARIVQKSGI
jgi:hypothetical protein